MKKRTWQLWDWGGPREGAGRKPKGPRAGITHATRPRLRHLPLHVSVRVRPHIRNLRSRRIFRRLERAFYIASDRFGMRITHFHVLGNHLHLIVEAEDKRALSRGMQGLGIRIAKAVNRILGLKGAVLADRYFARRLFTPGEVRRAIDYVLRNHVKHFDSADIISRYSSEWYFTLGADTFPPVAAPYTWMVREATGRAPPLAAVRLRT